ncbi:MAG: N-acyl-L-amino acid amidohydrolase [Bacteroidetes bacterium 43-16]|nr:MAG: N-acyl-L-amino acid amidohydrolase [Bacteroidetes bacterium 43-16]
MRAEIQTLAQSLLPKLVAIRQHLHRHPELSFEEVQTMNYIAAQLEELGIPYTQGVAGTGIVALIEGAEAGKCIALRADMDALPIKEQNEVPYKSRNEGVMHACGHDVHTTCLLGAAAILWQNRQALKGTVKLIFQPGEEQSPGGASLMIKAGVLQDPAPEAIIGLHVFPELPSGYLGFRGGQYMASADELHITIEGKGGHAALPQSTIDPIVIAANIIVQLQQIVSRRSHPLTPTVLSFGHISGGQVTNVIPGAVTIKGTLRTFDEEWRQEAVRLIHEVVTHNCAAWGATAHIDMPPGYPCLYNDEALTTAIEGYARAYLGDEYIKPLEMRMTAEDFSFYTQEIPGCFFRLGTNKNNEAFTIPVHHPNFDIDEDALAVGAGTMAWAALNYLKA